MSKKFTVQVIRKVTKIETARLEVDSDNATMARGVAKYKAETESGIIWAAGDDEVRVIQSKIVGVDSKP